MACQGTLAHDRCKLRHWTNEWTCDWLCSTWQVRLGMSARWWDVGGRGEGTVSGGPQGRVWPQPHWIKWIHGRGKDPLEVVSGCCCLPVHLTCGRWWCCCHQVSECHRPIPRCDSGQGGKHQPRHKAYVQGPGESGERWKCPFDVEQGCVCNSNNSGKRCLHKPSNEAADKVNGRQESYDERQNEEMVFILPEAIVENTPDVWAIFFHSLSSPPLTPQLLFRELVFLEAGGGGSWCKEEVCGDQTWCASAEGRQWATDSTLPALVQSWTSSPLHEASDIECKWEPPCHSLEEGSKVQVLWQEDSWDGSCTGCHVAQGGNCTGWCCRQPRRVTWSWSCEGLISHQRCKIARSRPWHKAGIQDLQEEKSSGEAAAGCATEGHGGNSISLEPSEMYAIQSTCFHQWLYLV